MVINEFRCYEAKIEELKKPAVAGSRTQDASATEPQQPDDHQPSQSSIYTAILYVYCNPHNPLCIMVMCQCLVTPGCL